MWCGMIMVACVPLNFMLAPYFHRMLITDRIEIELSIVAFMGRPELLSFSQEYTEYVGGRGPMVAVLFFKCALHVHTTSLKINIFNVLLWEGGRVTKKGKLSK